MKKIVILPLLLIMTLPLFSCGEPEIPPGGSCSVYGDTDIKAGMSFPPYSDQMQIDFTIRELGKLSVDRMRIAVDWRNREPGQGSFYWEPMDLRMRAAKENNISVFLTVISLGPEWACLSPGQDGACLLDENALQNFIEKLLERYDSIDKIQFGNEWESGSPDGTAYTDPESVEKFVTYNNILFDAVQRLSPDTEVVLGGLTRTCPIAEYLSRYGNYPDLSGMELAGGATEQHLMTRIDRIAEDYEADGIRRNIDYVFQHARYDMIDIHLYDDPENWSEYLSVLPKGKPVVVSEFGGPNSEFENTAPAYQAKRMKDYLRAIGELPITEAYYFKLVESDASYHKDSGLFFSDLSAKPARAVFAAGLSPDY